MYASTFIIVLLEIAAAPGIMAIGIVFQMRTERVAETAKPRPDCNLTWRI